MAARAAWTTGKVGSYRFSTGTRAGASGSCKYSDGKLLNIAVTSPRAKMRPYWTRAHGGEIAAGQWIRFTARLIGARDGTWSTLASNQRDRFQATKNAHKWMRMPTLPAFTPAAGLKSGYSAYRVVETLQWLRPLQPRQNSPEGSARMTLTDYYDGTHWLRRCGAAPAPVSNLQAPTITASSATLSWTNPNLSDLQGIIERYAPGNTPPTTRQSGTAIPLATPKATTATVAGLSAQTRYAFSIWTYDTSGHYSRRTTTVIQTLPAPRYDAYVQHVAAHLDRTVPWEEGQVGNAGNTLEPIGLTGSVTAGNGQLSEVSYAGAQCSAAATTFSCPKISISPGGTEPIQVHISRTDPSVATSVVLQINPSDSGSSDSYVATFAAIATMSYRTDAGSQSGNIFGANGDQTLGLKQPGQGYTVSGTECEISDQFIEVLDKNYVVVATAEGEGHAQTPDGSSGAWITQDKTGSTDTSVVVHWWYHVGVAARFQVRYTISGWNCTVS